MFDVNTLSVSRPEVYELRVVFEDSKPPGLKDVLTQVFAVLNIQKSVIFGESTVNSQKIYVLSDADDDGRASFKNLVEHDTLVKKAWLGITELLTEHEDFGQELHPVYLGNKVVLLYAEQKKG